MGMVLDEGGEREKEKQRRRINNGGKPYNGALTNGGKPYNGALTNGTADTLFRCQDNNNYPFRRLLSAPRSKTRKPRQQRVTGLNEVLREHKAPSEWQ